MAVRTLDQILTELKPTYDAQTQSLQERAGLIPQQIEAEEQGLQARQTQAFGDILGGARRRNLGFSGVPLQEQAQYTSTEFLPALARLRMSGREQAMSLQDAILGINERRDTLAQQIRQQEQDRYFQAREAQKQRQFAARQAALDRDAQRRASAAGTISPTLGGFSSGGGGSQTQKGQKISPELQSLFNQVFVRPDGSKWDDNSLVSDYQRTKVSAGYGNQRDKQKLQLYHMARPDLFGGSQPFSTLSNSSQLRF